LRALGTGAASWTNGPCGTCCSNQAGERRRTQVAGVIDHYPHGTTDIGDSCIVDARDEGLVLDSFGSDAYRTVVRLRSWVKNVDVVAAFVQIHPSLIADRNVAVARRVFSQRLVAVGSVVISCRVVDERTTADGRVVDSNCISCERGVADSSVDYTARVGE